MNAATDPSGVVIAEKPRRKSYPRTREAYGCRWCGKSFHPLRRAESKRLYCSMRCAGRANTKHAAGPLTVEQLEMLSAILADCTAALEANSEYAALAAAQNQKENSGER